MADSADLYRTVRLIRRFEQRAIEMVRSGVITRGIRETGLNSGRGGPMPAADVSTASTAPTPSSAPRP
jgi:acetoin:2,6-dichlorophenolindophenol oxidoreductase subunit alpha